MKISYFIEYLIVGTLYLIPYFIVHYTFVCYKNEIKIGFTDSIKFAYQGLPNFIKGKISLEIKNTKVPVFLFVFLLIIVGAISNGILIHLDDYWMKGLTKIFPTIYESNKETYSYEKPIKAMFKYDKNEVGELIGKIRFQRIITRHGLAHSIILLFCLPFIAANKKLKLSTKFIWIFLFIFAFSQAANGFLAINGWYEGVLDTVLMIQ